MTSYRIIAPNFTAQITEQGDAIVQADDVIHWTIGMAFCILRDHCRNRGWQIEPMIEVHRPCWLEYHDVHYEFRWDSNTIVQIVRHCEGEATDISFDELPEPIKTLL